jgi:hypothetical protein
MFGAPYVPIRRKYISRLLAFGELKSQDVFFDLGSGDGRVLIASAKDCDVSAAVGYEVGLWPYARSLWLIWRSGFKNISVHQETIFRADLAGATCVYCYLMPKLMDRVAGKLEHELRPGARIIVPSFPISIEKHPQLRLKKEEKIGSITAYLYEKI